VLTPMMSSRGGGGARAGGAGGQAPVEVMLPSSSLPSLSPRSDAAASLNSWHPAPSNATSPPSSNAASPLSSAPAGTWSRVERGASGFSPFREPSRLASMLDASAAPPGLQASDRDWKVYVRVIGAKVSASKCASNATRFSSFGPCATAHPCTRTPIMPCSICTIALLQREEWCRDDQSPVLAS
jgi:hypothetical protein